MSTKSIIKCWVFVSSSFDKTYQTLQYDDGSTSCDCKGWTRRCPAGVRSCRHTRSVDLGTADTEAQDFIEYDQQTPKPSDLVKDFSKALKKTGYITGSEPEKKQTTPTLQYGNRKLCL